MEPGRSPSSGRSPEKLEILSAYFSLRTNFTEGFVRHPVTFGNSPTENAWAGLPTGGEDINRDGNGQTILAEAERGARVGCDLNYLRSKENVRFSQV